MIRMHWKSDWLLASALSLVFLLASGQDIFQSVERKAYDWGVSASKRNAGDKIAIIAIDDQSIANIGRWPWSRDVQAQMLDKLAAVHPKVIGHTAFFLEPQTDAGLAYIDKISSFIAHSRTLQSNAALSHLEQLIQEAQTELNPDTKLAASIKNADNVVLAMPFVIGEPLGKPDAALPDYVSKNQLKNVVKSAQLDDEINLISTRAAIAPVTTIGESAAAIGHLNASPDIDGAIRVEPLVLGYYDQFYPSMALQIAARYLNLSVNDIQANLTNDRESVRLGNLTIATNSALQMHTFFYDAHANRPVFQVDSFFDVLSGKIATQKYAGKIVLIGATAHGVGDSFATPISASMKPIEILAHSVASILNEDFYVSPSWAIWLELAAWLCVALYLVFLFSRLKAGTAAIVTASLLLIFISSHYVLMTQKGWWIQLMAPCVLLLVGHVLLTTKRYLTTEKGKEKSDADSAESNRHLALMFQNQGQLDMAFDRFRKCPMDQNVMDGLYNLGLDFERKRQFNKAEAVFAYLADFDSRYKDLAQRITRAKQLSETVIFGGGSGRRNQNTLLSGNQTLEKPMLGRYQVEKELGKGAMGVVYLGLDPKISRVVAIKTLALSNEFDADELTEVKARFFREAETAGRLNHPNIVTIYDAGEEHDLAYIAMELLKGADLTPYTKPDNLLPTKQVIDIIIKVLSALAYAHASQIVHRDIKPANIMVEFDTGVVKVTDFGIARITDTSKTKTGIVLGTPSYMSPEQLSGKKVDGRSDLFSLGVMLYSLLTGELPFTADSMTALMYKIANEAHADIRQLNPELPECLAIIVNKMLEKKAENRYQTGAEIAEELKKCLALT